MEMEFQGPDCRRVVLRGMNTYPAKVVSSQRMEAVLRHQDIEWVAECFITSQDPTDLKQQYPADIQAILHKHDRVFGGIPLGRPPDIGFEHLIELEEGVQAVITTPYRHPKPTKMRLRGPSGSSLRWVTYDPTPVLSHHRWCW